jgi:hypothetical protein
LKTVPSSTPSSSSSVSSSRSKLPLYGNVAIPVPRRVLLYLARRGGGSSMQIYSPASGFEHPSSPDFICLLHKSLYTGSSKLLALGFIVLLLSSRPFVFHHQPVNKKLLILHPYEIVNFVLKVSLFYFPPLCQHCLPSVLC